MYRNVKKNTFLSSAELTPNFHKLHIDFLRDDYFPSSILQYMWKSKKNLHFCGLSAVAKLVITSIQKKKNGTMQVPVNCICLLCITHAQYMNVKIQALLRTSINYGLYSRFPTTLKCRSRLSRYLFWRDPLSKDSTYIF